MAVPKTKDEALQQMRVMWGGMVIAVALYVYIGETIPGPSWLSFRHAGTTFVILAALNLLAFWWELRKRYSPAVQVLRLRPGDMHATRRWMNMWIVLLCSANSFTLFGLALRMGGKTTEQTLPFYGVGLLLTLSLWPRAAWSSERITAQ